MDVISVQQSAKSVGHKKNQVMFWAPQQNAEENFIKELRCTDGDWSAFAISIQQWLNLHCAPHQLVSVSITEETHTTDKNFLCTIVHTVGKEEQNVPSNGNDIFKLELVETDRKTTWQ